MTKSLIKQRIAIAGTGVRSLCYAKAITKDFWDSAELVALFDRNMSRMAGFDRLIESETPRFTDFGEMVAAAKPTHVIIGTPDATHDAFVRLAFEHGVDVIVEKPMATTAERVRSILAAEKEFGRQVVVTFNYRFVPYVARVKELLIDGVIGTVRSVSLEWYLDKVHGAEYFRRWHAHMEHSGGLLVHKATHHFDLVNWLLADEPEAVAGFGSLRVYGKNSPFRGERCSTCPHAKECPFVMTLHKVEQDKAIFDELYWKVEQEDGYIRDRCLFREDIDIYDTMNAVVRYKSGTQLSYALNAYSPIEGYRLCLTGDAGRIEASETHSGIFMHSNEDVNHIRLYRGTNREDSTMEQISVEVDGSEHGGGDRRMYEHLFRGPLSDPLGQMAGSREGAMSCLIGIGANTSIKEGRIVRIEELVRDNGIK